MKKRKKQPKINTLIGKSILLKGDIMFSQALYLDGQINGNVIAKKELPSTLIVGRHGKVMGNVQVENLTLDGSIIGDVFASGMVQLAENAHVTGTVYYHLLEMESGAEVNGKMVHEKNASINPKSSLTKMNAQNLQQPSLQKPPTIK